MKSLKVSIAALAICFAGFSSAYASTTVKTGPQHPATHTQSAMEVKDLPAEVQNGIKAKYPDAKMEKAYKMTSKDGKSDKYKITLNNGGKETTVMVDAKGNIMPSAAKPAAKPATKPQK